MSPTGYGPDDPLSRDTVAALVDATRQDWRLVDAEHAPDGSDFVYFVTVADGGEPDGTRRDAVLKCFRPSDLFGVRTADRFLVEPDLLGIVGRETDLPVPTVYGVCRSDEDLPTPAFLMERLPGESATGIGDDSGDAAARFRRESGRKLARIHELRTFDTFGDLAARPTDDGGQTDGSETEGGPAGEAPAAVDPQEPVVVDGRDRWVDRLRDITEFALDGLDDTRFADLEPPLRDYVDDRLASADFDAESVLLHGDYRPGNLLADPETGEVTAVLDWGSAQAGGPEYELAWAVREFAGGAPVNSPTRRRVRETLLGAYERERGVAIRRADGFEERFAFYRSVTWIAELQWFEAWWADASESIREKRAARLRENLDAVL